MPILNYTTTIAAAKTVGEVQQILAKGGADEVSIIYSDGQPTGVSFALHTMVGTRTFRLPVNIDGVHMVLAKDKIQARYQTREHAARVAWRVTKDWIEAQVALIQAGMATLDQVMLPYLEMRPGHTLYAAFRDNERLAIGSGTTTGEPT